MKPIKVAISTVGCRANQADSGYLASHLDPVRVVVVEEFQHADIIVINTCCVTAEAERDCRKRARRALKASKDARVVLVGCAVNAVKGFGDHIDARIETKSGEAALLENLAAWINTLAGGDAKMANGDLSAALLGRTRGMLKIQTGCTHHCAYCIVPKARGKERSLPKASVLREIDRFRDAGIMEVVLTGVQMGAWGKDFGGASLAALIEEAADHIAPGRIRLSSIEPWSVDDALLDVMAGHPRVCPHLHLPLQHGDNNVLTAMRRGYDVATYMSIVDRARRRMPHVAIGTDIILGFPGEDDAAFLNTVDVLKALSPAYLHAFTFSPRPGTLAANAEKQVLKSVAQSRTREVRALGEMFARTHREAHVETIREVIMEEHKGDEIQGLTDTFVRARVKGPALEDGSLHNVRFFGEKDNTLTGIIVT